MAPKALNQDLGVLLKKKHVSSWEPWWVSWVASGREAV